MKKFLFLSAVLALLTACSGNSGSEALVLWSPDEAILPTGTLGYLPDWDGKALSGDFIPAQGGKRVPLDIWRVKTSQNQDAFKSFLLSFRIYQHWFAKGLNTTTFLRQSPEPSAPAPQFLTGNTMVKILDRKSGTAPEGIWWYLVLAPGGNTGWIPEDELEIMEHSPGMLPRPIENLTLDPLMNQFFSEVWRPENLLDQMNQHLVDPDNLKDDHLLRGDREERSVRISIPGLKRTFIYSQIRKLPDNTYSFEGTDLWIRFGQDNRSLTVYINQGPDPMVSEFTLLSENLGDIIARERARNREIYLQLYSLGPVLRSPGQGEIYLEKDQSFLWIPSPLAGETNGLPFFQKTYGNRGQVRLLLHLGEDLRTAGAQGVLSLIFEPALETPVHFVYRMERGGIQLWQSQPALPGILRIDTIEPGTPSYFFSFSRT